MAGRASQGEHEAYEAGLLTLGTREDAALLSLDNSTVDVTLVCGIGKLVDAVVGLDVLLNSLATASVSLVSGPTWSFTDWMRDVASTASASPRRVH
jgi:hypothetical protein